jgi:class 3 adenylate cyclase/tetratricopeptide (TPR) repeat protein
MLTCPSCGRESPEYFRFCGSCGALLAPARAREVRKVVTVLFADVTGSTALGDRLDPESLQRVMRRYLEEMKAVLERHGGTVEKFIGDAVMAVFGIPTLHEDDARRALDAAAAMRERLADLNAELERDFGVRLEARIGVNTGEVVTGEAVSGERFTTGDAVNVASRLEQAAAPGEILVGERTRELAGAAVEVEPIEPLDLKGKQEPVVAYRLQAVVEGAPAFERRLDAPLVGRRADLARVRRAFDEAVSERRCRLVTLLGPPGIGKSRLARAVAAELRGAADVLSGRCLPYGEGVTYRPLHEIFADAGAEDELDAALDAGAPEDIFWAVRKALEARARDRPLMLVVEDLHWAEPTFLDLLQHLADWTRDAPVLLLCNARPELLDDRPAWDGETLTLEPLAEPETDELITSLVGESELEDAARDRVRHVSEGNPLFVEQLLAMLAEGGRPDRVPPTIQALLAARLDALPEDERELLERASVVGLEFEWEALGELAADGGRPAGAQLAALVRKELIRPHEAIPDAFRFRHTLIRDAAYERIPKERRSDLHERLAHRLDGRSEELDEIVGYHLEQAHRFAVELGPPTDRTRALAEGAAERLAASGRRAHGRGDIPAAVNLLQRAAALLPSEDRRRLSLLPSLGRALTEAGDLERADSVLSQAVEAGRAAGERAVAADALVALAYLRAHTSQWRVEEVARQLDGVIRDFEDLGDEAGLSHAAGLAGVLRYWQGEAAAAIVDLERAARLARRAGDRAQVAYTLQYVLMAMVYGPMPVDEALERVESIRSSTAANRRLEVTLLRSQAQLEAMREHFDVARELIARAKALAAELGHELMLVHGLAHQAGMIELLAGDGAAAERELRPACEALERMGNRGGLATAAPMLAEALLLQERDDEALAVTESAERMATSGQVDEEIAWRRVRARLMARRGEIDEALRLAREATALGARTDLLPDHAQALADLADVLRLAGRPEESAAALREAIRLHEQKGNLAAKALLMGASASASS